MPISIKRLSDGSKHTFAEVNPDSHVSTLKRHIKQEFAPHFPNGCRLVHDGKVLKSVHRLKHYGITDNSTVEMDDRKNWSSSSSSSAEEK